MPMNATELCSPKPVPPAERPYRRRDATRVLVRAQGRVLLNRDTDPGVPGSQWWVTPGGGVDAGESFREAGARELFEETGLEVAADDLIGPIARRVVAHGYSDQVTVQTEEFYALDLPAPFEPDTAGYTPEEQVTLTGHGWFTVRELAAITVWPAELAEVFDSAGEEVVDWGDVEESTVPVELGHQGC